MANFVFIQRGDTAIHVAVRGRYRRICELLLRNPKDARILYRPNKAGETPYNIDRQHKQSILTQIFGTGIINLPVDITYFVEARLDQCAREGEIRDIRQYVIICQIFT